jgi:hypothetical protein
VADAAGTKKQTNIAKNFDPLKKYQMRGGKRAGAGRKKNTPNRASAERERKVAASGATPLDVMLRSMRSLIALADESGHDPKKFEHYLRGAASIARDLAPYCHPKLSAVERPPFDSSVSRRIVIDGGLPRGSTPEKPEGDEYDDVPPEEVRS